METRELTADEQALIRELYELKAQHKLTHAYVTTARELPMRKWNGRHPVDENTKVETIPAGATLKIVMVSRLGDCGLTDDLTAEHGYGLRLKWEDAAMTNIRREASPMPVVGIDRAEFLHRFPAMESAMPELEGRWGTFLRSGSCNFEDGRFVMVTRFERAYSVAFHNPANAGDDQTFETVLSPEALRALTILANLFEQPGDIAALNTALGIKGEGRE